MISLGSTIDPAAFDPLPDHVVVRSSVPQTALLRHTDVFVSHVGSNSMHESLFFGVPLVCIPCFADQPWNAKRAVESGAGVALSREGLEPERVRAAVDAVGGSASAARAARALGDSLRRGGGAARAIQVLTTP